jgi:hypothetical protein
MRAAQAAIAVALAGMTGSVLAQDRTALHKRREFFYGLDPLVRVDDVVTAVGHPDARQEGFLVYRLDRGWIRVAVDDGWIRECDHMAPGDAESMNLYWTRVRPVLDEAVAARREELVAARRFLDVREWGPKDLHTDRYPGSDIYLLKGGFLVIERTCPLMGEWGWFANMVSRATVVRDGNADVIWRLSEHWDAVRPAQLTDAALSRREEAVRAEIRRVKLSCGQAHSHGGLPMTRASERRLTAALGPADGGMGSGICRSMYYLRGGLLVVDSMRASLGVPGAEEHKPLCDWAAD